MKTEQTTVWKASTFFIISCVLLSRYMMVHSFSFCICWCLFISNVFLHFQTANKIYTSILDCLFHIHCIVKIILDASSHSHLQTDIHNESTWNLEVCNKFVYHFYLLIFPFHYFFIIILFPDGDISVTIFVFFLLVY